MKHPIILRRRTLRPAGFTLVEMLVVLAIIAVLVALTTAAVMGYITTQQKNNTRATVQKSDEVLKKQWAFVMDRARGEDMGKYGPAVQAAVDNLAGNDRERARVIWIKLRLRQEFPQNYDEAMLPEPRTGMPPIPTYQRTLQKAGRTGPREEASVCLLMALTQSRGGISLNPDDLGTGAIGTINPNNQLSLNYIVDAWGEPLGFYRWPTGNPDVDALNPAPAGSKGQTFRDPQDPDGRFMNSTWVITRGQGDDFHQLYHSVRQGNPPNAQPQSFYLIPVIASFGPDKLPGIAPATTMTISNANEARDNIYSYQLR